MDLTGSERMLMEMLREKDEEARQASQQRMTRFLSTIAARTGIPLDAIAIHPVTGRILDTRPAEIAMPDETPDGADEAVE